jgi:hypothetical protein
MRRYEYLSDCVSSRSDWILREPLPMRRIISRRDAKLIASSLRCPMRESAQALKGLVLVLLLCPHRKIVCVAYPNYRVSYLPTIAPL